LVPVNAIGPVVPEWHSTTFEMAFIAGVGSTVRVTVSVAALQGPGGSLVVNVNTIVPINPGGGVNVEVKLLGSEKIPPFEEVQLPVAAAPPTVPFNDTTLFKQAAMLVPASAVACALTTTGNETTLAGQGPTGSAEVSVNVMVPV
jgi:hypothetical protein